MGGLPPLIWYGAGVLTKAEIAEAKQRLKALEKELAKTVPLTLGSIVTSGAKHPQAYFSLNKDKRFHLIYLGEGRLEQARTLSGNYKSQQEIVEEMTTLNMDLLKNSAIG